ncbi:U4/U6.U5 small nuclear ribonucleoprotein 27 kDa protein-like [Ruditapes philippinarum]|uniref:U4/U6.U5 small nuclear ribonucleoprotein 27 kDa protein-like n=1 Tax=Ruditapes philippinarum TaxID=129788 RepID=UPI00295BC0A6|nr:U4/U6.U5 small nuclear ribonucleoprotein 27 kDa protein-like [Ruditapes philippinarum]
MPRSRSRSPKRERKRSRSRERERSRDRERHRRHRRSRSRSRDKGRRRSRSRERRHERDERRRDRSDSHRDRGRGRKPEEESDDDELIFLSVEKPPVSEEDLQNMPEDEQELMKVMGFSGFDTTKDKQVVGNEHYSANICKKRRYRQYMNRKGGFNRPLDFIA